MDLGDVMRELGLDVFTTQSPARGRAPAEEEPPMDGFEDASDAVEPAEAAAADTGTPGGADEMPDTSGAAFDDVPAQDDGGGDGDVEIADAIVDRLDDIDHQLGELASTVESNESTIRSLRSEREEVAERLEGIEETNATLLGVYDRLTSEVNPFAADWDERYDRKMSEQDGPRFGVIEAPEEDIETLAQPEDESTESSAGGVSFEDLKSKHDGTQGGEVEPEEAADDPDEDPPEPPEPHVHDEDEEAAGGETDGGAPTYTEATPPQVGTEPVAPGITGGGSDEPYLTRLAPTYASEVLVLEWLSMLIDTAGQSGAMKALDFYERINWISPEIKHQLEDTLSGANTDHEGPARPPSDLSAEEHNRSFAHIMRLAQQSQLARSREG